MAAEQPSDVWIEVEVLKGVMVSVYRGRVAFGVLEAWKRGDLVKGVMEINDTYWSYDDGEGNEGWVVVGATPGPYAGALGTTYVRAEHVLVVVLLRDGSERETHKLRPVGGASHDDDY